MRDSDLLILRGDEILRVLAGQETRIMEAVERAYVAHRSGHSSLPHSTFLRFPDHAKNRIIALPAYLGEDFDVAGVKWVSSFPENSEAGLDRASAVVILNSARTGRPEAVIEGSIISARRTAASAALAAKHLRIKEEGATVGVIGCGPINFEVLRFLHVACPDLEHAVIYDLDPKRARHFESQCRELFGSLSLEQAADRETVFRRASLVSIATTAVQPHLLDLSICRPGTVILHVSLRDIGPDAMLAADNIVDDIDHVCRAQTSVHLAEQRVGHRDFIRCTLADILTGAAPARSPEKEVAIFSPFGLGILDLAVSKLAYELAREKHLGTVIAEFLPESWIRRAESTKSF